MPKRTPPLFVVQPGEDDRTCKCGSVRWYNKSDGMTGTAYDECRLCGRLYPHGKRGYVDKALGLAIEFNTGAGSWHTFKLAKGLIVT